MTPPVRWRRPTWCPRGGRAPSSERPLKKEAPAPDPYVRRCLRYRRAHTRLMGREWRGVRTNSA
eukprot:15449791-Alexandrium_andersonii.AAC.1